jgi:hypothetical protein
MFTANQAITEGDAAVHTGVERRCSDEGDQLAMAMMVGKKSSVEGRKAKNVVRLSGCNSQVVCRISDNMGREEQWQQGA